MKKSFYNFVTKKSALFSFIFIILFTCFPRLTSAQEPNIAIIPQSPTSTEEIIVFSAGLTSSNVIEVSNHIERNGPFLDLFVRVRLGLLAVTDEWNTRDTLGHLPMGEYTVRLHLIKCQGFDSTNCEESGPFTKSFRVRNAIVRLKVTATTPLTLVPGGRVFFNPEGMTDTNCVENDPGVRKYCRLFLRGTEVHLLAVPDSGFHFAGWSGDRLGRDRELTVEMNDSLNIRALFSTNPLDTIKRLTVIASSPEGVPGGRVFFLPQGREDTTCENLNDERRKYCRWFVKGDTVLLHAEPDSGFFFAGWVTDSLTHGNNFSVVMSRDISMGAVFVSVPEDTGQFALLRLAHLRFAGKVFVEPRGIELDCGQLPETRIRCLLFRSGTEVTLAARPNENFSFLGWRMGDSVYTDSAFVVTVEDTVSVFAMFEQDTAQIPTATKFRTFSQRQLSSLKVKPKGRKVVLPDSSDARDTIFTREVGKGALVLGVAQTNKDSAKRYGWIVFKKAKEVAKFFLQTGESYFFDSLRTPGGTSKKFVKALVNPKPPKYNNHLAGELAALKLNIAASRHRTTRPGFGGLIYTDENSQFNGMTIMQINRFADSAMTYWRRYQNLVSVDILDSVVSRLNKSFLAQMDSTDILYKRPLRIEGRIELDSVPFLQIGDSVSGKFEEDNIVSFENSLPENPTLLQNYPNPFNPTTAIGFSLLAVSNVTLKVYDVLGQEVVTLLNNESLEEGTYDIQFDARDLSSGMYYYRLTTRTFSETRKMLLVK
ncbi:MAG: T9SS type A sorting domain-containing protein [Ignavibacteriales bacterium]|nr:T9SS type A sorting domain-containing protein [Ignavibacteriales bacterium]